MLSVTLVKTIVKIAGGNSFWVSIEFVHVFVLEKYTV